METLQETVMSNPSNYWRCNDCGWEGYFDGLMSRCPKCNSGPLVRIERPTSEAVPMVAPSPPVEAPAVIRYLLQTRSIVRTDITPAGEVRTLKLEDGTRIEMDKGIVQKVLYQGEKDGVQTRS